jgi:hypothetical protein
MWALVGTLFNHTFSGLHNLIVLSISYKVWCNLSKWAYRWFVFYGTFQININSIIPKVWITIS